LKGEGPFGSLDVDIFDVTDYIDWLSGGQLPNCQLPVDLREVSEDELCHLVKHVVDFYSASKEWRRTHAEMYSTSSSQWWNAVADWQAFDDGSAFGCEECPSDLLDGWIERCTTDICSFVERLKFEDEPPLGRYYTHQIRLTTK
jgi:hypothetical protein